LRQKAEGNQQLTPQHLVKKPLPRIYAQTIIRIRMPGHIIAQVWLCSAFISVSTDADTVLLV
jgi:hypothetical protein